jgi:hypothetical protein
MRTKTLLIAAAALAAGVISSEAQVYSQNIVGYVNTVFPAGQYAAVNAPLAATSTNAPEDALTSLATGDSILFWSGSAFSTYVYISPQQWIYPDGSTIGPAPNLGVGPGFFYLNGGGAPETNTFVGTVVLTNTVTLPAGNYALVGSTPPIADSLDGTNLNLPLQTGDSVLLWSVAAQSYDTYVFISDGQWIYPDGSTIGAAPSTTVGNAFFYLNGGGSAETWTQNFIVQ